MLAHRPTPIDDPPTTNYEPNHHPPSSQEVSEILIRSKTRFRFLRVDDASVSPLHRIARVKTGITLARGQGHAEK
jgi:hypothetical protein